MLSEGMSMMSRGTNARHTQARTHRTASVWKSPKSRFHRQWKREKVDATVGWGCCRMSNTRLPQLAAAADWASTAWATLIITQVSLFCHIHTWPEDTSLLRCTAYSRQLEAGCWIHQNNKFWNVRGDITLQTKQQLHQQRQIFSFLLFSPSRLHWLPSKQNLQNHVWSSFLSGAVGAQLQFVAFAMNFQRSL